MTNFKIPRMRDEAYLAVIREMPCHIQMDGEHCNGAPVDAHHLTCINDGIMGDKAGDDKVLPACRMHHRTLHRIGELTFWHLWEIDAEKEAKRLWEEYKSKNTLSGISGAVH